MGERTHPVPVTDIGIGARRKYDPRDLLMAWSAIAEVVESGMTVDLDAVPRREPGMEPFEVMISESQERMLAVILPERRAAVEEVCARVLGTTGLERLTCREAFARHAGIALEPQFFPDAPNHPVWQHQGCIVRPGQPLSRWRRLQFLPA